MLTASRPVMPWMMKVVSLVMRIDMRSRLPFIFATARPAASYIDTVRSQYSTP